MRPLHHATAPPRDTHLLSGGTGGLGLLTGRWLAAGGASTVVLAARGGAVSEADGARLRKARPQCSVCVARADAAELADIRRLVSGARCGEAGRLAVVWHVAGGLSDGVLRAPGALDNLKRALDMGVDVVGGIPHFLEVKNCHLVAEDGWGYFPYTVSDRAAKHVACLAQLAERVGGALAPAPRAQARPRGPDSPRRGPRPWPW